MEEIVSFGTTDYIIMVAMLLVSLGIGAFFAYTGRHKTSQVDYLLGGRQLGVIPVCLSLFATFNSAVSLLGLPAELYIHGAMVIYLPLSIALANLSCLWTLLPLVYPLRITSIYEYLEMRFQSRCVRLLGAGMGMFGNVAYMTIALLSPALALQTAAGLPLHISLIAVGSIGTLYTAIGGIKSVVWTDAFQTLIMFVGIIATLVKGSSEVGGFSTIWARTSELGRLTLDEVDPDPRVRHTIWGMLIGSTFYWMSVNFSQSFSQRLCSTKSKKDAKTVISLVAPLTFIYGLILVLTGMTILVYFDFIGCDPLAAGYIKNPNQFMPYFVIRILGFIPGLSGLYISTIFSGALSTLSSGINSLAANTVEDILKPCLRHSKESTVTAISKITVAVYGIGIIGLAYLVKEVKGPITQMMYTAVGATGGPIFGLFLLGGVFPQANKVGAVVGWFAGISFSLWLNISKMLYGYRTPSLPNGPTDTCQNVPSAVTPTNSTIASVGLLLSGNGTTPFSTDDYNYNHTLLQSMATSFPDGLLRYNRSLGMTDSLLSETWKTDAFTPTTSIPANSDTNVFTNLTFRLYDLSYLWLPLLGTLVTVIVGVLASLTYELLSGNKTRAKPKYLFPFVRRCWQTSDDSDSVDDENNPLEIPFISDKALNKHWLNSPK